MCGRFTGTMGRVAQSDLTGYSVNFRGLRSAVVALRVDRFTQQTWNLCSGRRRVNANYGTSHSLHHRHGW